MTLGPIDWRAPKYVICADDSPEILMAYQLLMRGRELKLFKNTSELREFCESHPGEDCLYLIDFDFKEPIQGLDIIEGFGLGARAVLVTGMSEDADIQKRCATAGCRLIAKDEMVTLLA